VAHPFARFVYTSDAAGYSYDAAGNMTVDGTDSVSATYDSENRIATASKGGVSTNYTYDADGNRVKKTNGSTGTLYWYMTPGIVAESDLSGNLKSEYVFFNGERVARRDLVTPTGVFYYFSDHLKTASVITDSAGNIKAESDYYPWGGELQFVNNDSNHYKFTGKERDSETQLDYFGARYYSNGLGRFISADWSATPIPVPYADLSDPQSLNLFSYTRNLPTTRADPDGHFAPGNLPCYLTCKKEQVINEQAEFFARMAYLALTTYFTIKNKFVPPPPPNSQGPQSTPADPNQQPTTPPINDQKQNGHVKGTAQYANRLKAGKSTSTFADRATADSLTQDTWDTGTSQPDGSKIKDYVRPIGEGPNGGTQSKVRVTIDSKGTIHGTPWGPVTR